MKKRRRVQRVKIGKSFFVPVLLKVVSRNPDGTPRWLEIAGDDETIELEHGSREFYIVWGSELLAGRVGQSAGVGRAFDGDGRVEPPTPAEPTTAADTATEADDA